MSLTWVERSGVSHEHDCSFPTVRFHRTVETTLDAHEGHGDKMLQGSLDNFGLNEVLGLLADTSKTGRMRITGDRGSGSLWLVSGKLVGSEASRADDGGPIEETMFELLRFSTGNFSFNSDETTASPSDEQSVDDVLGAAFERLHQWREIEAVVPSLAHIVAPVAVLPAPEVTVTAEEWDLLMAIGAGAEVGSICEHFGLGEVEGSRRVKLLIERSLIEISDPSPMHAVDAGAVAPAADASVSGPESDDFGLAPAGLTTDDTIDSTMTSPGAFDAVPSSSHTAPAAETEFDRGSVWADAEPDAAEPAPAPAWTPAPEFAAPATETAMFDAPAVDAGAVDAPAVESSHFESPALESSLGNAPAFEAPAAPAPAFDAPAMDAPAPDAPAFEIPAAPETAVFDAPPPPAPAFEPSDRAMFEAEAEAGPDAFTFPSAQPDPQSGLQRRASDSMPPPPPAPPTSFDQFDAPAPPPPAPPSPADLVGSERVDGAEARRLLAGRSSFAADGTETGLDDDDATATDDDGSLLMQYLSDEG